MKTHENGTHTQDETMAAPVLGNRFLILQIIFANAVPVIGVWFLDWQAIGPILFYWLDGLLALWGLGVVAAVVTNGDGSIKYKGIKLWLTWAAIIGLLFLVLALPSVVTALFISASMRLDIVGELRQIFSSYGAWFSLLIVIWSYTWQAIAELRWKPNLTIKQSGEERLNLFFHRTLLMGLLVFWCGRGQPSRWALAAYVLVVALLYTYTQLYPVHYLRMIGFKKSLKEPSANRKDH